MIIRHKDGSLTEQFVAAEPRRFIPSKRLKTGYRAFRRGGGRLSLRQYARLLRLQGSVAESSAAEMWAGGKLLRSACRRAS